MKSAYFTFKGSYRTLHGKVTLNDDGKISVNLHDGRMGSANLRYQAKKYAEKIVKENFTDPTITNIQEVITDSNLIQILYRETESLKIQYIEKCTQYATQQFHRAVTLAKLNAPDLYTRFNIPFTFVNEKMILPTDLHTKYRSELKTMSKALSEARNIAYQTESRYVDKAIKSAEKHYEQSIIKLALRIESKGLDVTQLKTQTAHVGVNIETILTDGNLTVKAWTIIAEGPIQQPHYRYLVK
mgnify:CR=1 FL=1